MPAFGIWFITCFVMADVVASNTQRAKEAQDDKKKRNIILSPSQLFYAIFSCLCDDHNA